jgi:hypothetical protein
MTQMGTSNEVQCPYQETDYVENYRIKALSFIKSR